MLSDLNPGPKQGLNATWPTEHGTDLSTKGIIWGISPWPGFWSMGKEIGTPSYYYGITALVKAGFEFHLFALNDGQSKEDEVYQGIQVHRFAVPAERFLRAAMAFFERMKRFGLVGYKFLEIIYMLLYTLAAVHKVIYKKGDAKPFVIYAYTSYSALTAHILSKIYGAPYITRLFGTFITSQDMSHPLWLLAKWQEVLAFKLPSRYLVVTNDGTQGDRVALGLGVDADRLKFWRNGINKDMYDCNFDGARFRSEMGLDPSDKIVLTVSRLIGWKRLDRLIKAVPYIIENYGRVVFLILGDGPEREPLEKLSRHLGMTGYVRFMGAIRRDKVADYMNAADIFVSVNDFSNVSNGLYEAMICGKCIIALDDGCTGDLIQDNHTGKLIPARKEDEIILDTARAIVAVLEDNGLREMLSENARSYAQDNFETWEQRLAMEVELITALLKSKGD